LGKEKKSRYPEASKTPIKKFINQCVMCILLERAMKLKESLDIVLVFVLLTKLQIQSMRCDKDWQKNVF
jgi:hypothetical protein